MINVNQLWSIHWIITNKWCTLDPSNCGAARWWNSLGDELLAAPISWNSCARVHDCVPWAVGPLGRWAVGTFRLELKGLTKVHKLMGVMMITWWSWPRKIWVHQLGSPWDAVPLKRMHYNCHWNAAITGWMTISGWPKTREIHTCHAHVYLSVIFTWD